MSNPKQIQLELTGIGVISDFSDKLYNGTVSLFQPLTSGKEIFKKMRKRHLYNILDYITRFSPESQEKLIDVFTDFVSLESIELNIKFKKKLKEAIDNEEIRSKFEFAEEYFKTLKPSDKQRIFRLSIIKSLGDISSLRNEVNFRMWEKNAVLDELMIIDQILYKIEEILRKNLHNFKHISRDLDYCLYLILRLEAFGRKKIDFNQLKISLSEEPFLDEYKPPSISIIKPDDYNNVISIFGV